jgi:glycosidase
MSEASWLHNATIYHILIDRFAGFPSIDHSDEPVFIGGTLKGITEHLSYLQRLGVTAIWISPFYRTSAYHGYHITDFLSVDPHFGTKQDLKDLIDQTHKRGMKILADFVPNHCSRFHPFFIDAQKNSNSPYRQWFYFTKWPEKYLCFLSISDLPKLNLNNHEVRQHIIDAALYWLSLGFDGFRLDHVIGPSHRFWKYFVSSVKKEYPQIVLIGEAWMQGIKFHELNTIHMDGKLWKWLRGNSSDTLLTSYIGVLDGVLDFRVQQLMKQYVSDASCSKNDLDAMFSNHFKKYPSSYVLPVFLDNHDMDRFMFSCKNNVELLKDAAKILFSLEQPIIIYYGTELGMSQQKSIWSMTDHGDILARAPMQWDKVDSSLFSFYQDLIKQRN